MPHKLLPASLFLRAPVRFLTSIGSREAYTFAQGKSWGSSMLDMATRKELAALVYERAETEGDQDRIFLPDDGEDYFGATIPWYQALLLWPSALVC
jgi:hypothetical protein